MLISLRTETKISAVPPPRCMNRRQWCSLGTKPNLVGCRGKCICFCTFKVHVIPLKLFYYRTFLKLGVINIHDNAIKNGVTVLVNTSQALKIGVFLLAVH